MLGTFGDAARYLGACVDSARGRAVRQGSGYVVVYVGGGGVHARVWVCLCACVCMFACVCVCVCVWMWVCAWVISREILLCTDGVGKCDQVW